MKHISIIPNAVKRQFDNVISVIHASQNPYDLAPLSSNLLDAETRTHDQLFDPMLLSQAMIHRSKDFSSKTPPNTTSEDNSDCATSVNHQNQTTSTLN